MSQLICFGYVFKDIFALLCNCVGEMQMTFIANQTIVLFEGGKLFSCYPPISVSTHLSVCMSVLDVLVFFLIS